MLPTEEEVGEERGRELGGEGEGAGRERVAHRLLCVEVSALVLTSL